MENIDEEKLRINAVKIAQKEQNLVKNLGFGAVINLILGYSIAFSIWGLALKLNFLLFVFIGIIVALLIIGFLSSPLFFMKRTPEHIKNITFIIGIWLKFSMIVGVGGLIFWVIRVIFFR